MERSFEFILAVKKVQINVRVSLPNSRLVVPKFQFVFGRILILVHFLIEPQYRVEQ